MATVQEFTIDLASITSLNSTVPFPGISPGQEFSDLYISELPLGAPVILFIGMTSPAGFRNVAQGDAFDCVERETCKGSSDGIGVQVSAFTVGIMRIAVTMGGGGAAKNA